MECLVEIEKAALLAVVIQHLFVSFGGVRAAARKGGEVVLGT